MNARRYLILYLFVRFAKHRALRIIRQSAVAAVFVVFIFALTAMNVSFDLTFHQTNEAVPAHGAVGITDDGRVEFGVPPGQWYWNASQAAIDNASIQIWARAKLAFDAVTWTVATMLIAREMSSNYSDAKQENEEMRKTYGLLYILGVGPDAQWPVFFLQKLIVYAVGVAAGSLAAVYVLLPFVLAQFRGTIGALFFTHIDYTISFLTACFMVSMGMSIRAFVLMRGTRHAKLGKSLTEIG